MLGNSVSGKNILPTTTSLRGRISRKGGFGMEAVLECVRHNLGF